MSEQENARVRYEEQRLIDPDVMDQCLGDALEGIEWPSETNVAYQIDESGKVAFLDVDLPEIEDFPRV